MIVHPRLIDYLDIPNVDVWRYDDVVPRIRRCGNTVFHDRAECAELAAVGIRQSCIIKYFPIDLIHILGVGRDAVTVMAGLTVDQILRIEVADQDAVFLCFGECGQTIQLSGTLFLAAPVKMQCDDRDLLA